MRLEVGPLLKNAPPDDLTVLEPLHQHDLLAVVGPDLSTRQQLHDWVVAQRRTWEDHLPHRIAPVRRLLENSRGDLLAFADRLGEPLTQLAHRFQVAPSLVRQLFETQAIPLSQSTCWQQEGHLRQRLGLAIVQRIVQKYGGILEVEIQPGEGTPFPVLLPVGSGDLVGS